MPKVSIITPVYNRPQYLEEAVLSIQSQTYTDWEHIIIDDGSTNPLTQEVLKRIESNPKVTILKKENAGLGAARNFGIEQCTGEFILTLDDDDKWREDFIEKALDMFKRDDTLGAVTSRFQEIGDRDRLIMPLGGSVKNFLVGNNCAHAMFKKKDWADAGKYDEDYSFQAYTDWDLWLRISAMGKIIGVIDDTCFFYRIHKNGSMLADSEAAHLEMFRYLIEKNKSIYAEHITDALILLEGKLLNAFKAGAPKTVIRRLVKRLIPFKK